MWQDTTRDIDLKTQREREREGEERRKVRGSEGKEKGILDCNPPIKCHLIPLGKTSAFSINSCA